MATVTVLTVTHNAGDFLPGFLESVRAADRSGVELEIVVVDNGSGDGTPAWIRQHHPEVRVLENDENNYARALNLGIRHANGEFIVICNNDGIAGNGWLQGMLEVLQSDVKIGAAQSRILFSSSGRINSVGVEETEQFYFRDIGFGEESSPRFDRDAERNYVSGGSVMFRKACLDAVGPWDEEFIMYMEDVDYSVRCRRLGWKLWYASRSVFHHQYHGSVSDQLCEYFCSRNRLLFVAKHYPGSLPSCIPGSHFYRKGELDLLYRALLAAMRKLMGCHGARTALRVIGGLKFRLPEYLGEIGAHNFFAQLELMLGLRRIRVGIYDHAGHFAGGGQRYVAEMAALLQDRYDVTYIFNNDVDLAAYADWFDIDLGRCRQKIIRIPFFDKRNRYTPDEAMVVGEAKNPFDLIARESLEYDVFINANMLGKVNPLALASVFVCHFPDQEKQRFFHVDKYDHLITNSEYTGEWVRKRWQLEPSRRIYPPVHMRHPDADPASKEKLILSVSRFEVGGSKKQLDLVRAFRDMCRKYPEQTEGWRLVLAGGSTPGNDYLENVRTKAAKSGCPIDLRVNVDVREIRDLYRRAALFWHACGLGANRPEWVEHFGMTTVESMQNGCVPIVIDGGGQREIVAHGETGFRFSTVDELIDHSLLVMGRPDLRVAMALRAQEQSERFNRGAFGAAVEALFEAIEADLMGREELPA